MFKIEKVKNGYSYWKKEKKNYSKLNEIQAVISDPIFFVVFYTNGIEAEK